ncbi:MAG: Ig-like domain repeat protein [Methanobrevibacter sp.]|nr:Ig-like domain repeat protein [Methanobrevibacter sp.]
MVTILKNTSVSFNINGITYTRTTNEYGSAKLNINLKAGEYIITAYNSVTGEMRSNNITVLSRFSENADLVKYYRNDSQYVVRVIGDDGNPLGAGENVTFNINGVLYTRSTNESGYAKLNINLGPGDYIVTAEYKTCLVSNNIKVKPVLTANDMSMTYGDGSKFTAHLLDGEGNPYQNQTIDFNINGVFYSRTTDVNGDGKLDINLMPGEYIITSSYNGYNISNKITVNS